MAAILSIEEIASELAACEVTLPPPALEKLSVYLELLVRWNQRINLTGLREPRLIVRRLFGESLYLANILGLEGWLVDVGSGAGFPGLALKLAAPELRVTLLEPRQRKAAFLKEVIREIGVEMTDVVTNRFESWVRELGEKRPHIITTRAVNMAGGLLLAITESLAPAGTAVLFTSVDIAQSLLATQGPLAWRDPVRVPSRAASVILLGKRPSD